MNAARFGARLASVVGPFALGACAHLTYGNAPFAAGSTPFPTPVAGAPNASPIAGPTSPPVVPQTCETQAPSATFIAMGSPLAVTTTARYGAIFGYAVAASFATLPSAAAPIDLRTSDVVQFVNVESLPTSIAHSAAGFPGATSFPASPVVFPAGLERATGTTIGAGAWSTGSVAPQCFSRTFALAAGTNFFGDLTFYNLTNFRDVIAVSP